MTFLKVKDKDGLVRDTSSGAIINTNVSEYQNYMKKRKAETAIKEQVDKNSEEIQSMKSDITEIKQLLISLINKDK